MQINTNIFYTPSNLSEYFIAKYYVESSEASNLKEVAHFFAVGQTIGNANERCSFENQEMWDLNAAKVLNNPDDLAKIKSGVIEIAFPEININFQTDGVTQLLVMLMGGNLDSDIVKKCHLLDIQFTEKMLKQLKGPKIGLSGLRKRRNCYNKPLFGGIVKPKTGLTPEKHLDLVKILIDNGCDFIKEDEILSSPDFCPIEKRVPLIMNYLDNHNPSVIYCVSIHSDMPYLLNRVKQIYELGANGLHVNFWSSFGAYKSIRDLDLPLFMHYQYSGSRILSDKNHNFHIDEKLTFKLICMMGCDSGHAGMIGGYMDRNTNYTKDVINQFVSLNSVATLSCGMNAGLIEYIRKEIGHDDWMANVGGALGGHPEGIVAGVKAMRQAIDKNYGLEYGQAVNKWGIKK